MIRSLRTDVNTSSEYYVLQLTPMTTHRHRGGGGGCGDGALSHSGLVLDGAVQGGVGHRVAFLNAAAVVDRGASS